MLVTDAMSSVGAEHKDFVLQGRQIRVADGICAYEDGTLAGSDLDMATAVANAMGMLGLEPAVAARRMLSFFAQSPVLLDGAEAAPVVDALAAAMPRTVLAPAGNPGRRSRNCCAFALRAGARVIALTRSAEKRAALLAAGAHDAVIAGDGALAALLATRHVHNAAAAFAKSHAAANELAAD